MKTITGKIATAVAAVALLTGVGGARADIFISGNNAALGGGPIQTWNFTTKTFVNQFVPDGAFDSNNGRGLAITDNRFLYTELTNGFGPTDRIRIAPYNNGAGGNDIGALPNPNPDTGVQDLAFGRRGLYALVGYNTLQPTVYLLDPNTGAIIGPPGGIALQATTPGQDGFTVLRDGTFIGNVGDAVNSYTHWAADGSVIASGFQVPSDNVGGICGSATGVDIAPDSKSLFFMCNFNTLVQTDLNFRFLDSMFVGSTLVEDIAIRVPEPASLALLGTALAGLGLLRRRRRAA